MYGEANRDSAENVKTLLGVGFPERWGNAGENPCVVTQDFFLQLGVRERGGNFLMSGTTSAGTGEKVHQRSLHGQF